MQSNIAQALSLRFPPLAINYTWEPPADAAELHPLCSMLLLARAKSSMEHKGWSSAASAGGSQV